MGATASSLRLIYQSHRSRQQIPVFVVTLDALGTLYGFRKPVSVQYAEIARNCGLKSNIDHDKLNTAFKAAFKRNNAAYPNYGKRKLDTPEQWWNKVVDDAFSQVIEPAQIPTSLGTQLYRHFSSDEAYELYPDAAYFMQSMRTLKSQFTNPDGPIVVVGVVTNSDPRVRQVLQAMGFNVGLSELINPLASMPGSKQSDQKKALFDIRTPLFNVYDEKNDFDFLATSYNADAEKPAEGIWDYARQLLEYIPRSRAEQGLDLDRWVYDAQKQSMREGITGLAQSLAAIVSVSVGETMWIHIGDDYAKDYQGAELAGFKALLVDRPDNQFRASAPGIQTVPDLQAAAMVVNLMARQHIKAHTLDNL